MFEKDTLSYKLNGVGKFLRFIKVAKFYHDGGGASFIWRWWNPLSWVLAPLFFIIYGLIEGFPSAWENKEDIGFGYGKYFREHPEDINFDENPKY